MKRREDRGREILVAVFSKFEGKVISQRYSFNLSLVIDEESPLNSSSKRDGKYDETFRSFRHSKFSQMTLVSRSTSSVISPTNSNSRKAVFS